MATHRVEMRPPRPRRLVGVLLFVLLAGCERDGLDTYELFLSAHAAASCEQYLRCDAGASGLASWRFLYDVYGRAECRGNWIWVWPPIARYVTDGTARYDEDAARACIAEIERSCVGEQSAACRHVVVGTVPVGGACAESAQCASSRCSVEGQMQCGACLATVADGEACESTDDCTSRSYCSRGTCRLDPDADIVEAARGEACGFDLDRLARCAAPLHCDATGVCAPRHALGETCDLGRDGCEDGAACREVDVGVGRCVTIAMTSIVDARCGLVDGQSIVCDPRERLRCDVDTRTCVRLLGDGEIDSECTADAQCDSGLCASLDGARRCVAGDLPDGAPCDEQQVCASGHCAYDPARDALVCASVQRCD